MNFLVHLEEIEEAKNLWNEISVEKMSRRKRNNLSCRKSRKKKKEKLEQLKKENLLLKELLSKK